VGGKEWENMMQQQRGAFWEEGEGGSLLHSLAHSSSSKSQGYFSRAALNAFFTLKPSPDSKKRGSFVSIYSSIHPSIHGSDALGTHGCVRVMRGKHSLKLAWRRAIMWNHICSCGVCNMCKGVGLVGYGIASPMCVLNL
jgi:hypothetical protein